VPTAHAVLLLIVTAIAFFLYTRPWIRLELVSLLLLVTLLLIFYLFPLWFCFACSCKSPFGFKVDVRTRLWGSWRPGDGAQGRGPRMERAGARERGM
jgi:hypothetical protein